MSKDRTPYVQIHSGVWDNRKFMRLVRILNVDEFKLLGHLVKFWQVTNDQADVDTGRLKGWDHVEVAAAARWSGDPETFCRALLAERLIHKEVDGTYRMHEWEEYGGLQWTMKRDARDRKAASLMGLSVKQYREKKKQEAESAPAQLVLEVRENGNIHSEKHAFHSDVTVKSADFTEDRNGSDRIGTDRNGEGGSSANGNTETNRRSPQSSGQDKDRSRQNPIPTRSHSAHFNARGAVRLNGKGVGFGENPETFPQTVEELIAQSHLQDRWPWCDGKNGRPTIAEAVTKRWDWYLKKRNELGGGHANALKILCSDVAGDVSKHRYSWEKDGGKVESRDDNNVPPSKLYEACMAVVKKAPPHLVRYYDGQLPLPPDPAEDLNAWANWTKADTNKHIITAAKKQMGAA